jgi:formylglycine-generating enzyme required for sulfatase activity
MKNEKNYLTLQNNTPLYMLRGGSWRILALYLRASYRGSLTPNNRRNNVGFRLVKMKNEK